MTLRKGFGDGDMENMYSVSHHRQRRLHSMIITQIWKRSWLRMKVIC